MIKHNKEATLKKDRKGGDVAGSRTPRETNHKLEGPHKHKESREDFTPGTPNTGDLHWED